MSKKASITKQLNLIFRRDLGVPAALLICNRLPFSELASLFSWKMCALGASPVKQKWGKQGVTELTFSECPLLYLQFFLVFQGSVFHDKTNVFYKKQVLYEKPVCLIAVFLYKC